MKIFDTLFSSLVSCLSSMPLILLLLIFANEPDVPANPPLDLNQINAVQQLLIDHDPRQLLVSDYQEVRLSENELNALITYIRNSNEALREVNIHTNLVENGAELDLSMPINILGFQPYLNLSLQFELTDGALTLRHVNAGAMSIPPNLLPPLTNMITSQLSQDGNYQLISAFFDSLHFQEIHEEQIVILLDWQEENRRQLEDQARQVFVSAREAERLIFYHEKLLTVMAQFPDEVSIIPLNDLLRPLFLFASLNSAAGVSAIAENRAVFIVLSAYLTEFELSQLIGNDVSLTSPRALKVVIESREDLAQHLISSAAISSSAGATMAEVLSIYKEVHDSRYRSGFSFTDIAANLSGSLLGTLASRTESDAQKFQSLMSKVGAETEYLPDPGAYDGLTEEEFNQRYGSRDSDIYRQRLQEINDNIRKAAFFQKFDN